MKNQENIEVEFNGGLILEINLEKLENAIEKSQSDIDYDNEYKFVELGSSLDTAYQFFMDITDEKLAIYAEYYAEDDDDNPIEIVRVQFLNCECPENLKKYYEIDNEILLIVDGKLIEIDSSTYNNIDINESLEYAEIKNSGVQSAKASSNFYSGLSSF